MKRNKNNKCNNNCKDCKYGIMACGIWFCDEQNLMKMDKKGKK